MKIEDIIRVRDTIYSEKEFVIFYILQVELWLAHHYRCTYISFTDQVII